MDTGSKRSWQTSPEGVNSKFKMNIFKTTSRTLCKNQVRRGCKVTDIYVKAAGPTRYPPLIAHPFPRSWAFIYFLRWCNQRFINSIIPLNI